MGSFSSQAALGYEGYMRDDDDARTWYDNLHDACSHWKKRAQRVMLKNRAHFVTDSREFDEEQGHFKEQDTDQLLDQ